MPSAARSAVYRGTIAGPSIRSLTRSLGTGPSIQRLRRHSGRTDGCKDFPMSSAESAMYRIESKTPQLVHAECRIERKPPQHVHTERRIERKASQTVHPECRIKRQKPEKHRDGKEYINPCKDRGEPESRKKT